MTGDTPRRDRQAVQPDRATMREWARKTYLRATMRTEALSGHELKLLDDRLARWTADRQADGELPPEAALRGQYSDLERDFRSGHEPARPILTPDEIIDVDASRSAVLVRNFIDQQRDNASRRKGVALQYQASAGNGERYQEKSAAERHHQLFGMTITGINQVAVQYAVSAGLSELNARKMMTERFEKLFGRTVTGYAQEQQRQLSEQAAPQRTDSLFPVELGWERYEPAFRRMAMHEAKHHVDREDGVISEKEFHEARKQRDTWAKEQRQRGKLPEAAEISATPISIRDTLLPFQKQFGWQERMRQQGEDSAYWRRVDETAGYVKGDIEGESRYAKQLEDYAVNHAASYGKRVERMKNDIEQRFALHYLYSPSEYLEKQLEAGLTNAPARKSLKGPDCPQAHERGADRTKDGGRER